LEKLKRISFINSWQVPGYIYQMRCYRHFAIMSGILVEVEPLVVDRIETIFPQSNFSSRSILFELIIFCRNFLKGG
ncbi:MAG TPA: hypothetical protein VFV08_09080, partial [Puia sp.]|nr:hypothetical protein [Puia sp.]